MKSWITSILLIIGLIDATSSSLGQAAKSQPAKSDEAAHTLFLPSDRSRTDKINKGDRIDVSATWRAEAASEALRSIYILEDIEVLDVRSSSNKNPTKAEKEGTYLVLQLTKPKSILLKYFKERALFFDVDRRKAGDKNKVGTHGWFIESKTPPEQMILDKWLGAWRTSHKQATSDLVSEEKAGTAKVITSRIVSEQLVQEKVEDSDKTRGGFIFTYDNQKKCYRRWEYSFAGKTTESTGKWDTDKKTMTWTSAGEPSSITTTTHRFVDDDHAEWDVVTKDRTGKLLFHMEGKSVRIKASK